MENAESWALNSQGDLSLYFDKSVICIEPPDISLMNKQARFKISGRLTHGIGVQIQAMMGLLTFYPSSYRSNKPQRPNALGWGDLEPFVQ